MSGPGSMALEGGASDPEADHIDEDQIQRDVLAAIAEGATADPPAELAREALRTVSERWYA